MRNNWVAGVMMCCGCGRDHCSGNKSTSSAITSASANPLDKISGLKWLHLCMICSIATDTKIPRIWMEVAAMSTRQEGLTLLVQYILLDITTYHKNFNDHADIIHMLIPLYNFVVED